MTGSPVNLDAETEGVEAVLALGSNLGDRRAFIRQGIADIDDLTAVSVVAASSLFDSVAVKPDGVDPDAPGYLNAVIVVHTTLTPHDLLAAVNAIEDDHGRVRVERWGDRTLDIDIITYGTAVINDDRLTLPHPEAWQRDFVLAPWLEIDPMAVLPGRGGVRELLVQTADEARPEAGAARAGGISA
jgi:2-amino-4-hydroxy-6-hydroxymethyldihydropteridine diphosphokinase